MKGKNWWKKVENLNRVMIILKPVYLLVIKNKDLPVQNLTQAVIHRNFTKLSSISFISYSRKLKKEERVFSSTERLNIQTNNGQIIGKNSTLAHICNEQPRKRIHYLSKPGKEASLLAASQICRKSDYYR